MKKDDKIYVLHIRDAIDRILKYTAEGHEKFSLDSMIQDAVVRNLEIIGEASKHLSSSIKENYSDIPWKRISGMRDKMIHEYFGVNLQIVWNVVKSEISILREKISSILKDLQ